MRLELVSFLVVSPFSAIEKAAAYEWLPKIRAIYSIYNGSGSTTRSINAGKKEREKGIGICIASFMAWRADGALESANHKDDATASSDLR